MNVGIEELAEILQTGLNANAQGLVFEIAPNVLDIRTASRDGKRYEVGGKLIQGVLTYMTSDIVPIVGIGQSFVSTILRLAVDKNNVESVMAALQDYIELAVGTQKEVGSYKVIINFQMPNAGQARIEQYGVNVPLEVVATFRIVQNGVTFGDTEVFINGKKLPMLSCQLLPIKNDDPYNKVNEPTINIAYKAQCIGLIVTIPYIGDEIILELFDDVFKYKNINKFYNVTYKDTFHSEQPLEFKMAISEFPMASEPMKNNGITITFKECDDSVGVTE